MQNCSVGPLNPEKRYSLQKYTCLDYIKLHDVHGSSSDTVAGSEAFILRLQPDPRSTLACRVAQSFVDFLTHPLMQENQVVS